MALWFPRLATERILRRRLGRGWRAAASAALPEAGQPLIVSRKEDNALRIAALDERAEALGLRRGMGIADARAMHPAIEVVDEEEAADRRLLDSLADWCDRYTPLVALDGGDGLFLDITGCAHLFGGEKAMLDDVLRRLFEQGFDARAGLASTPGAAWAAARFMSPALVEPGAEAKALAPLPLAALRLEPAVRADLASVGLRHAGSVMASPRAPLARRFGAGLLNRLDQALGRVEEPVSPRLPVAPLSAERHLAEPVVSVEDVERLVLLLGERLKADLERRGEGARGLALALFRVDGAVRRIAVGVSRPLREPALMQRLFSEKLAAEEDIDAGYGFELVRLSVTATAPFEMRQADLAGGRDGADDEDLALFADRVRARLGEAALARHLAVESHVPERAVARVPLGEAMSPGPVEARRAVTRAPRRRPLERPIRLLSRPEPVEVAAAEVPEGPPLRFRWRRTFHRVAHAEGPERIAPEWWRDASVQQTRDYFRIEDEQGRRYWLYRQGRYGTADEVPRWFMHGLFA